MTQKTILIIGCSGQLTKAFAKVHNRLASQPGHPVHGWKLIRSGRPETDLTDRTSLEASMTENQPDIVINTGAFTAVDLAETEESAAYSVNSEGAKALAQLCASRDIPLVHFSTDYVFSGDSQAPYLEDDAPAPLSAYGRSKLAGERAIALNHSNHFIFRIAWVYSEYQGNFLTTILRLARQRDEVGVVNDQYGHPTYADDVAEATLNSVPAMLNGALEPGIFHLPASGLTTWYDFAVQALEYQSVFEDIQCQIKPISTEEYPYKAKRPENSSLNGDKFAAATSQHLPHWKSSVETCIAAMNGKME